MKCPFCENNLLDEDDPMCSHCYSKYIDEQA